MSMLENIRRIGIFMIAAQTVMHFAAGKQYEKYMKIIAGVIILLQFISPFVSSSEDMTTKWQEEAERMSEQIERQMSQRTESIQQRIYADSAVETTVLRQIEAEVKSRFNEMIAGDEYQVSDVAIELDETGEERGDAPAFRRVRIVLRQIADGNGQSDVYTGKGIKIDPVIIGKDGKQAAGQNGTGQKAAGQVDEHSQAQDAATQEYRRLFAQMLGIAQDRVEVTCDGE